MRGEVKNKNEVKNKDRQLDDRKARLAQALRANLLRRKAQAKHRLAADEAENAEPAAPCAVNPPQTDPKGGGETR